MLRQGTRPSSVPKSSSAPSWETFPVQEGVIWICGDLGRGRAVTALLWARGFHCHHAPSPPCHSLVSLGCPHFPNPGMGQFGVAELIVGGFEEVWGPSSSSSSSSVGAVCVQYHGVLLPCCRSGHWERRHRSPKSSPRSIPAFPRPGDTDTGGSRAVGCGEGVLSAVGCGERVFLALGCRKVQCCDM